MKERRYLRTAVGESMVMLAEAESRIVAVSADVMGSCRMTEFVSKFPDRSFNVGIAEQEMISFSAGLAKEGFIPYSFTFGPFMSMRACEQIRDDVAYNKMSVRFISTYSGVSGGISGVTHWALEDCAIMRSIADLTILEPCDCIQLYKMLEKSINYKGPIYFRVTIEPVSSIYKDNYEFEIGRANRLIDGSDGTFICSGIIVKYAIEASNRLKKELGLHIGVVDMHTIKPIDENIILEAAKTKHIVVAQDHSIIGGLGEAVAVVLVQNGITTKFRIKGTPDSFFVIGHAPWLYNQFGLDSDGLYNTMKEIILS